MRLATSLIGPMNVTRAVLPVMRKRFGHIISISSSAALSGFEFGTAYAASKFGLEGWMESLHAEVAPFGITTTIVNPGFFRTELLTEQSTNYAEPSIEDYDERRAKQLEFWKAQNGQQSGDPAKLARALIVIASQEPPPRRFMEVLQVWRRDLIGWFDASAHAFGFGSIQVAAIRTGGHSAGGWLVPCASLCPTATWKNSLPSADSFWGAWRTIAGYEAIHMIRKGQACWSAAGAKVGLMHSFILGLFAATS
jgi:hypothetical protein